MTDINAIKNALNGLPRSGFNRTCRSEFCSETPPVHSPLFNRMLSETVMFFLIASVLAGIIGCRKEGQKPLERLTLAVAIQPISAPVYVAYEKGFFKEEGLDVALQSHWTGKEAFASVLKGTAQFGTVAETPLMFSGLKGEKFYIVATIADSNRYQKIVARKDRGIAGPKDLAGKKIGVCKGTTAEYHLDAFLTYYGINHNLIHAVPMKTEDLTPALEKGDIDATVVWPPHIAKQQKLLGSNALTIENEKIYSIYWNIVTVQDYAKAHPETVKKLLRAIARAERYIKGNADAVHAIVAKKMDNKSFSLADYNFDLYQSHNLLLSMEDQARWAIRNRLAVSGTVPNFLPLFYLDGIKAVAPESVSLIFE